MTKRRKCRCYDWKTVRLLIPRYSEANSMRNLAKRQCFLCTPFRLHFPAVPFCLPDVRSPLFITDFILLFSVVLLLQLTSPSTSQPFFDFLHHVVGLILCIVFCS